MSASAEDRKKKNGDGRSSKGRKPAGSSREKKPKSVNRTEDPQFKVVTSRQKGKVILEAGTIEGIVYWLLERVRYPPSPRPTLPEQEPLQYVLTADDEENDRMLQEFIISYRSFVAPSRFFNILQRHYQEQKVKRSRYAVLLMLSVWLEKYLVRDFFFHDRGNRLFDQLLAFIHYLPSTGKDGLENANRLKLLVLRAKYSRATMPISAFSGKALATADKKKFAFCELPIQELAEQLTLIELDMFQRIREREFLNLNWKKPDCKRSARHIVKMVERFNKVSFWVATRIVRQPDLKRRASDLKRFIILAEKCAELNNFNTLMEVLGGLNLHPVQRLRRTWEALGEKYVEAMRRLENIMASAGSYRDYREHLLKARNENLPALPYLGVYLRDLLLIEEGNSTRTSEGLINYEKIQMVGAIIREVQFFQEVNYNIAPTEMPATVKYLKKLKGLKLAQLDLKSRELEPNEAKAVVNIAALVQGSDTSSEEPPATEGVTEADSIRVLTEEGSIEDDLSEDRVMV